MYISSGSTRRGGGGGRKKKKYLKMEENKYLKERLPSQLHRAEMWKRKSKQAWSLGWFGRGGRRRRWRCGGRAGGNASNTKQEMVAERRKAVEDEGGKGSEEDGRKGRSSGMTASTTRAVRLRRARDKIKIQIMEAKQVKAYFEWVLSVRERSHVHTASVSVEAGTYGINKRHGAAGNMRRKVFLKT